MANPTWEDTTEIAPSWDDTTPIEQEPVADIGRANEIVDKGLLYDAPPEEQELVTSILSQNELDDLTAKAYHDQKFGTNAPMEEVLANNVYEHGEGASSATANASNAKTVRAEKNRIKTYMKGVWNENVDMAVGVYSSFGRRMASKAAILPKMIEDQKAAHEAIAQKLGFPEGFGHLVGQAKRAAFPSTAMLQKAAETLTGLMPDESIDKMAEFAFRQSEKASSIQSEFMSGVPMEKLIADGEWEKVGEDLVTAIGFEVPNLITQLGLARISPMLSMAYMGAGAAAEKRAELGDTESAIRNAIQPYFSGLLEVGTEKYVGTGRVINRMAKNEVIQGAIKRIATIGLDFIGGAASEGSATLGGNILDKAFGDDVGAFDGVLMSAMIGGPMDMAVSLTTTLSNGDAVRARKQNTDEQIDAIVSESPIPDEQKPFLEEALKDPNEQTVGALNSWVPEETGEGLDGEVPEMKLGEGFVKKDEVDVVGEPAAIPVNEMAAEEIAAEAEALGVKFVGMQEMGDGESLPMFNAEYVDESGQVQDGGSFMAEEGQTLREAYEVNEKRHGRAGLAPVLEENEAPTADIPQKTAQEPTGYMTDVETMDDVQNITRSKSKVMSRVLTPIREVIGDVSPVLKGRLDRWEFDTHQRKKDYAEASLPFLENVSALAKSDRVAFTDAQLALKDGRFDDAEKVLGKEVIDNIRAETSKLADDLEGAGYEVPRKEDYFPRRVKDLKGLRNKLGKEAQSLIDEAIAEQQRKAEAKGYTLSDMEVEKIINNVINGSYRPVGGRSPKSLKKRTIQELTPELDVFYYDAIESWIMYQNEVADIVELRKFLGKDTKSGDVVDMNESIGKVIDEVRQSEGLSEEDVNKLIGALRARLGYRATGKKGQMYRSMTAMTTLGQYTSALTQLGDFTWSFYENGLFSTAAGVGDVIGKSGTTMQDLGIDEASAEFKTPNGLSSAVDTLFKFSGLKAMDKLGKEVLVNATLREYQKSAETGTFSNDKQNKLDILFGADQASVIADLKAGNKTRDIDLLLFSTIMDWHPTTLSNMPAAYLEHPNGRIFYTLKTFTVKQLDNFRRVAIDDLVDGVSTNDMALASRGFGKLMKLAGIMLAANIPIDILKDILTGKDFDLSDTVLDNLFKLFGFSRYNAKRSTRKGQKFTQTLLREFFPPAPFIDYPIEDLKYIKGQLDKGEEIDMMDLESWNMVPFVGRSIYWRYGKGEKKEEKARELD